MRTVEQFVLHLRKQGIKLWMDGERLRYRAPKGALTAALRQELREKKAELVAFLGQAKESESVDTSMIQPVPREQTIPLSFAQQRLWFLDRLQGPNATYNIPKGHHITGPLNVRVLEKSLCEISLRHESLRTTFPTHNGLPQQRIAAASDFKLPVVTLQTLPEAIQEAEVQQRAINEARQPFDLENGPLWRATLLCLGVRSHVLLITMHHIIFDGFSMGIFMDELLILYEAFSHSGEDKPLPLPLLPIQYADFTVWQRQLLQGEKQQNLLNYWTNQLSGAPPLLELPTDHSRPASQSYRGSSYFFALPKELSEQLTALSLKSGTTLFMTLLAAFNTLLYRYSGQEDILVGTPSTNRNQKELENIIGFFANTLVLRTDLSDNPTFLELLEQVRQTALDAYKHKDLPLEQLIEALQPERSLTHNPLFQVMFVLQNERKEKIILGESTLTPLEIPVLIAKFDLTLDIQESQGKLTGSLEYSTDLFEHTTIQRMATHFQTLLASVVANPDQPIAYLPLLTESEKHQLLVEWNAITPAASGGTVWRADYPSDKCMHQLFEEQVERTPDAIALVFENKQLTYRELNTRANQLAHHLIKLGVGPDVLVGICIPRSIEMVVGLLGILKAGGAYVPLDPTYPQERIQFMLQDSGVQVVLTVKALVDTLAAGLSVPHQIRGLRPVPRDEGTRTWLCLDMSRGTPDQDWAITEESNPQTSVKPNHLAYCIYTSGSTGSPKGVMIEHQSLTNFLHAMSLSPGLAASDKLLAVTTISFDIAALELYLPLVVGGQVILASEEEKSDGLLLLEKLKSHVLSGAEGSDVTVMQATPATWRMLLASGWQGSDIKLLCGGEALPHDLAQELRRLVGAHRDAPLLWNMYGPTESTIWSTTAQVTKELASQRIVSIGRPILNTQLYLLDKHLQPVPIGVAGQLYIGGAGVARGYLNRPQLTAEKFIPNPYGEGRLYKTGDLCRYLSDGNIEFVGRIDHQVKIRGFRIELGEIEALLSHHPSVQEVVVVVREEVSGQRLVAYLVSSELVTSHDMRSYLAQKLPDYMIPSAFVQLEAMPLTPNGKIDRRALPAPDVGAVREPPQKPRTPTEKLLVGIWQEVLGIESVGVHDNFFEMGGHSLLAIQILSHIRQTYGALRELSLRHLFEFPTIAELGQKIDLRDLSSSSKVNFKAEVVLDPVIHPSGDHSDLTQVNTIFLTGATGFLGAYLLYELLQQTTAEVYCLVRSNSVKQAQQRVQGKLEQYALWNEARFKARIHPVVGDLEEPLLGLSQRQFDDLASQIDLIYHNGASVNFVYPYSTLKAANVLGTQEVLRLATQSKTKPLHHISTMGVFPPSTKVLRESASIDDCWQELENGYAQSKWVAEKLLMEAQSRGLPLSIYRPSTITGHSQTGISNTDDFFNRMIKGTIQLGMSAILDGKVLAHIVPVDYASQAIVHLSLKEHALGEIFHIVNPHSISWNRVMNIICSLGYPLQELPYKEWRSELINHTKDSEQNALYPLLPYLTEELFDQGHYEFQIDCQNTLKGLADSTITCAPVDRELGETYFQYFYRSGYLPPLSTNI